MIKVTKSFSFDMAHLLDGHDGKCRNLHGHTYRLEVEVSGQMHEDGPKKGMVIDFSDLKDCIKKLIIEPMDHAFAYDETSDRERQIAEVLISLDLKVYRLAERTTAEALARHIFFRIRDEGGLPVSRVRLWETPDSSSEFAQ